MHHNLTLMPMTHFFSLLLLFRIFKHVTIKQTSYLLRFSLNELLLKILFFSLVVNIIYFLISLSNIFIYEFIINVL